MIRSLITSTPGWILLEIDLSQIELRIAAHLSQCPALLRLFHKGEDVHWSTCLRELSRGGGEAERIKKTAEHLSGKKVNYGDAIEILLREGPKAAQIFDDTWKELRKKAKAVNFGYLFGMWWKKFKIYAFEKYGIVLSDRQARESRKFFFSQYPGLEPWHNIQKGSARRRGYVTTMTGRRRR